jgi:TRAP-type C4-dicarboxylate transport system permease small subunit
MHLFKRITGTMAAAIGTMEIVFMSLMTLLVCFQVLTRYVFSYSLAWSEELARYLMIWGALLASGPLFEKNGHIRMDLIFGRLPLMFRVWLNLVYEVCQLAILSLLFKLGLEYVESMEIMTSTGLRISMRWPTMIVPISVALMIVFILAHMIQTIADLRDGKFS